MAAKPVSTVRGFTNLELQLLIRWYQYGFVSSCFVAHMLMDGVWLWLWLHKVPYILHIFLFNHLTDDPTEKWHSWLLVPTVHDREPWIIMLRCCVWCKKKINQPPYKQTHSISHFIAGRHQHMALLSATVANKSHLEQRQESCVIRSLSGAGRSSVTNQSIQSPQHM